MPMLWHDKKRTSNRPYAVHELELSLQGWRPKHLIGVVAAKDAFDAFRELSADRGELRIEVSRWNPATRRLGVLPVAALPHLRPIESVTPGWREIPLAGHTCTLYFRDR
ncbi:MAG TPA: hypothetical protein VD838_21215 [Anaeromyxobacteraceae bacterium]|nr:hypothetical protein [Anaeromyxobacteraceae bacterium]